MERLNHEEEEAAAAKEKERTGKRADETRYHDSGAISDQIGLVQFNMGGIQVDANDMLQRLKHRDGKSGAQTPIKGAGGDQKTQNKQLANFFAGLMSKNRTGGS